jgi:LysM repeat protein
MPLRMIQNLRPFPGLNRRPKLLTIAAHRPRINKLLDSGISLYAYTQGYLYRAFSFLKIFLSLIIFLSLSLSLTLAQDCNAYIRDYKDIAIAEMLRTGIPASIKLAQGMVESNCGTSELARKANNHFGIKCGGDWTGKSFHKEDDDYKDGELTKSCFREFNSPFESYVAHSDFLTDPKKSARYGSLFLLKTTDYKGWARGLLKAGYATDPNYADKLIKIIEDNLLYELDSGENVVASAQPSASLGSTLIRTNNKADYVVALDGDNLASISQRYDVNEKQLMKYNDNAYAVNQILSKGTKVYLEPKHSKFHGKQKYYVLRPGEDLIFVSQQYGIKLSALQKRNGIEGNQVPAAGQKIMLKGKSSVPIKTKDPYQLPDEVNTPAVNTSQVYNTSPKNIETTPSIASNQSFADTSRVNIASSSPGEHIVAKGDTLFSIAQNFGLSVEELKKRNNLSVDSIYIGQKLIIK